MIRAVLVICGLMAGGTQARAETIDGAQVRALVAQAAQAAGHRVSVDVSDNRGFPPCAVPLQVHPRNAGWRSVSLICDADPGWQRVLRTTGPIGDSRGASASVDSEGATIEALVLTAALPRGTLLTADHFTREPVPARGQTGLVTRPEDAIGRSLETNLGAGQPLLARHLSHDWAVRADESVTIEARRGPIVIETAGVALEPGQLHQRIEVRNTRSGRVVQATVTGPNKVSPLP